MKRALATALYWIAAITIALGAYGHGFVGVVPVRTAVAGSALAPEVVRVVWIVWYFVSGCMLAFGLLLFWAWRGLTSGRSAVVLIVGALYLVTGIASYLYSGGDPFWLVFVVQGALAVGSTLVLRESRGAGSA